MNRSRQHARGSATAAFLLALVLTLLVAATVFAFAAHIFPAPAPITVAAVLVDQQYTRTLYVGGAVFVLAIGWLVRKRAQASRTERPALTR